jgi:hypothetical protein
VKSVHVHKNRTADALIQKEDVAVAKMKIPKRVAAVAVRKTVHAKSVTVELDLNFYRYDRLGLTY